MKRIKTEWASVIHSQNTVIVCVPSNAASRCILFESLELLQKCIETRKLLVRKWALAIPQALCISKRLSLPTTDLNEAVKMIEFELPSLVPLPPEEIAYGCTLVNRQNNNLNLLVSIIKIKTLDRLMKSLSSIGINPHLVTLDSLAVKNWFNTVTDPQAEAEIDVLLDEDKGIVLSSVNGNLRSSVQLNLSQIGSRRKILRHICNQRDELPASFKEKSIVLFAGSRDRLMEVEDLFGSASIEYSVFNRASLIAGPTVTSYDNQHQPGTKNRFTFEAVTAAGLIDLAVNSTYPQANLLPRKYLQKYERKARLLRYLLTAALLILCVLMLWLCLNSANWRIQKACRPIESRIAPIEDIARNVETKRQRVRAIQKQLSNRGVITRIIKELYQYTPDGISISHFKIFPDGNKTIVEIKGQADRLTKAFKYSESMRNANLLRRVQIENAQQVPRPGGSIVIFKANCVVAN